MEQEISPMLFTAQRLVVETPLGQRAGTKARDDDVRLRRQPAHESCPLAVEVDGNTALAAVGGQERFAESVPLRGTPLPGVVAPCGDSTFVASAPRSANNIER